MRGDHPAGRDPGRYARQLRRNRCVRNSMKTIAHHASVTHPCRQRVVPIDLGQMGMKRRIEGRKLGAFRGLRQKRLHRMQRRWLMQRRERRQ